MLAKHGPWEHHVEINGSQRFIEVCNFLETEGWAEPKDYEIIEPNMGVGTKKSMTVNHQKLKYIFLMRDRNLSLMIKLKFG